MEIQAYATLVVPFMVLVYLAFLLAYRPPRAVILGSLVGGLVMAAINILVDILGYNAHWWHYDLQGLILHVPLPFYATPIIAYGGIGFLLIWRYWSGRGHWFALLLLIGLPLFRTVTDLLGVITNSGYVVWDAPLAVALVLDLLQWLVAFYAGYLVFRRLAPPREQTLEQTA